jgi:hypothetical protein
MKHNFGAGPCILPQEVFQQAAAAVLDFNGLSILEVSHRHKDFVAVMDEAIDLVKKALNVPEGYSVAFLQGGATLPTNTNILWDYTMNSTATTSYLNGDQDVVAGGASFSGTSGTLIGANTYGTSIINGTISEILIYNQSLENYQRQYVEGCLAWKWGLEAELPSGHPYATQAPPSSLPIPPLIRLKAIDYAGSGDWLDQSGNEFNATLEDGSIAKNTDGNGIVLDGATSWTFPNVGVGNAWSANVWYKNTGSAVGPDTDCANKGACILTQIFTGVPFNIIIGSSGDLPPSSESSCVGFNSSNGWNMGTIFTITLNTWINIQATWNGTNLSTYINGSLLGTTQPGISAVDGGSAYRIGRRWDNPDYLVGEIGEVRIYNYPLTQTQVTADYNASSNTFSN